MFPVCHASNRCGARSLSSDRPADLRPWRVAAPRSMRGVVADWGRAWRRRSERRQRRRPTHASTAAHRALLADKRIQFDLPTHPPDPPPPAWLKQLLEWIIDGFKKLADAGPVVKILFWLVVATIVVALLRWLWPYALQAVAAPAEDRRRPRTKAGGPKRHRRARCLPRRTRSPPTERLCRGGAPRPAPQRRADRRAPPRTWSVRP